MAPQANQAETDSDEGTIHAGILPLFKDLIDESILVDLRIVLGLLVMNGKDHSLRVRGAQFPMIETTDLRVS